MGLRVVVLLSLVLLLLQCNADEFTSCLKHLKNAVQDSKGSLAHWNFDSASSVDVCNSSGPFGKEVRCNRTDGSFLLSLSAANLSGDFSSSLSNCSTLTSLNLNFNSFNGSLDGVCEKLQSLTSLSLRQNHLTGSLLKLGTCKRLTNVDVSSNRLTGPLPRNICSILPALETFNASYNSLNGSFPSGFDNCSYLGTLDLSSNLFTGHFPPGLKLPGLTEFDVSRNNFSGVLYSYLQRFGKSSFGENRMLVYQAGPDCLRKLHKSVRDPKGHLKTWAEDFDDICKLTGVECDAYVENGFEPSYTLNLAGADLEGRFPACLEDWVGLTLIDLRDNKFTGSIPGFEVLIQSRTLSALDLSNNKLTGQVPDSIFALERLNISYNEFSGTIPYSGAFLPSKFQGNEKLVYQGDLTCLQTFRDSVGGAFWIFDEASPWDICKFPGVGCIPPNVDSLELSNFNLSGTFPRGLENCTQLKVLRLSNTLLTGSFPSNFCYLVARNLVFLDMHHNELLGNVPDLSSCMQLKEVDLSYNLLTGFDENFDLPASLKKLNLSDNRLDCVPEKLPFSEGNPLKHCGQRQHGNRRMIFIMSGAASLLFLGLGSLAVYFGLRARRIKNAEGEDIPAEFKLLEHLQLKERDFLQLTSNFSNDFIVGRGGSSTVYQGRLADGQLVAVKKLEFEKETILAARKNFIRELQILGKLRHRNLVKVLGYYSNLDIMAVILEYMPFGTLEALLHPPLNLYPLGWIYRHRFAVEVAQGLNYLHQDSGQAVVHSDLKPSNILLDEEFTARIADFGVAKMLDGASQNTYTFTWTIGYAAPEVAQGARPTSKADVYSFGIILMEMLTGERPCSPKFEDVSLRQYVLNALDKGEAHGVLDRDIQQEVEFLPVMLEVLKLAVRCTGSSPTGRPDMNSVLEYLVWLRDGSYAKDRFNTPIAALAEQPSSYDDNADEQAQQASSFEVASLRSCL